jgi:hypothetical protein
MRHNYSYQSALAASERVGWKVDDIIGGDKKLDFTKPFLPESLARVRTVNFLSDDEKRTLNQIRGFGYLIMFGLVEEFILPFVLDHARPQLSGNDYRVRALLQFASEEAKHIHLFKRFRQEFEQGFGHTCEVIGPPQAVAEKVLSHHPLAVALVTLHIEWFTQRHYLDSVKDDQDLDSQFKSLLKHHWLEEAQHTKLDTLVIEAMSAEMATEEIKKAVDEYIDIGGFLDAGMQQQAKLDIESFERATGRRFGAVEREQLLKEQLQALRWTFIGSGMTHPNFLATVEEIKPEARKQIEEMAPAFC